MLLPVLMDCPHWSPHPADVDAGRCAEGHFSGNPHKRTCLEVCSIPKRLAGLLPITPILPCSGCGDNTNIAQVKSSPAALEQMLTGE